MRPGPIAGAPPGAARPIGHPWTPGRGSIFLLRPPWRSCSGTQRATTPLNPTKNQRCRSPRDHENRGRILREMGMRVSSGHRAGVGDLARLLGGSPVRALQRWSQLMATCRADCFARSTVHSSIGHPLGPLLQTSRPNRFRTLGDWTRITPFWPPKHSAKSRVSRRMLSTIGPIRASLSCVQRDSVSPLRIVM